MAKPTAMDEQFVHQLPQLLPQVATRHEHWRESHFFDLHAPSGEGDVIFFTMAHYPWHQRMDSLQMGRIDGDQVMNYLARPDDGDPHTTEVPGARVEVVRPWEEIRLWADPSASTIGLDLTFRARTQPYGLRRGTMRAGDDVVWDQCHILQSGTYSGTYTSGGTTRDVDGWIGQRDHSWGIRDHGRCPLWIWFQIQLDDGFLGVWHWEYANGARVYTDGCWAGADGSDPVPVVGLPPRRAPGSAPTAPRRTTASTVRRSPGCAARASSCSRAVGASRSRPTARSPARTSRSIGAGSTSCGSAPTTAARARRSTR